MKHRRLLALAGIGGARRRAACTAAAAARPAPSAAGIARATGEGELNLVIWAGLRRSAARPIRPTTGSRPFETETGCKVNTNRHDRLEQRRLAHAVRRLRRRLRLRRRDPAPDRRRRSSRPVNTTLIPNYANVFEGLKNQAHNTVNGVSLRRAPRPRRRTC